jgi:hypothetical protein
MEYAKAERCIFGLAVMCLVIGMGSQLAMPLFIGKSIDAMNRIENSIRTPNRLNKW